MAATQLRLTRDDLQHIAPRPKTTAKATTWDNYVAAFTSKEAEALFAKYEVNTPQRARHFLATVVGETNLSVLWESGAYSASRIVEVFGAGHHSSAIKPSEAAMIASLGVDEWGRGPRADALFERAYGYKTKVGKGLGNIEKGDGAKYPGLGPLQITGRYAHEKYANKIGIPVADLAKPINCLHAALIEWTEKNCNKYADNDDAVSIRKLINGGSLNVSLSRINGLPQVMAALRLAKTAITSADFGEPVDEATVATSAPTNENKPDALYKSTEMQAGTVISGGSGYALIAPISRAIGRSSESGSFRVSFFVLALLGDPEFLVPVAMFAAGIFLMLKRRKRYYIFGV